VGKIRRGAVQGYSCVLTLNRDLKIEDLNITIFYLSILIKKEIGGYKWQTVANVSSPKKVNSIWLVNIRNW